MTRIGPEFAANARKQAAEALKRELMNDVAKSPVLAASAQPRGRDKL